MQVRRRREEKEIKEGLGKMRFERNLKKEFYKDFEITETFIVWEDFMSDNERCVQYGCQIGEKRKKDISITSVAVATHCRVQQN